MTAPRCGRLPEPLLIAVFVANLLAATQDIATDALALELLAPEDRGLGNGIEVAGYRAGIIFGGGFMLMMFEPLGWAGSFGVMGTAPLVGSLPVLQFLRTSARLRRARTPARRARRAARRVHALEPMSLPMR